MIATIPSIPNVCNCLPNIAKSSPTPLNASPNLTSAVANCSFTFKIFNCLFCCSVRLSKTFFWLVSTSPNNLINLIPASSPGPPKTFVIILCVSCAFKEVSFNPCDTNWIALKLFPLATALCICSFLSFPNGISASFVAFVNSLNLRPPSFTVSAALSLKIPSFAPNATTLLKSCADKPAALNCVLYSLNWSK